jgi:hypothetical protein
MPLARIISTSAKYSDGLADDLRSRGFQVLTSAPGDTISEFADLEITLNECLADEARAASSTAETKDMRVFLTPQAFAGNIRSIEMFVLTPKMAALPKLETDTFVDPTNFTSATLGRMLEFAVPAEAATAEINNSLEASFDENTAAPEAEFPSDKFEEPQESADDVAPAVQTTSVDPQSTVARAILASKQSAWPDMAEMKLVPAELVPAVKSSAVLPQISTPPERPSDGSAVLSHEHRDRPFFRMPIIAGVVAVLALSTVWLASHFSASHIQEDPTSQQLSAPASQPVALPTAAVVATPAAVVSQSTSPVIEKPSKRAASRPAPIKAHVQHAKSKRHSTPESDYVAKDTTVYFSGPSARQQSNQRAQARP